MKISSSSCVCLATAGTHEFGLVRQARLHSRTAPNPGTMNPMIFAIYVESDLATEPKSRDR